MFVSRLAEGRGAWSIPWPCIHELFAIVTHPRIHDPPTPGRQAVEQIEAWLESPSLELLGEAETHWSELRKLIVQGRIEGPMAHDARVAAICLAHGVRELWTADRDLSRFSDLRTRNPLVEGDAEDL